MSQSQLDWESKVRQVEEQLLRANSDRDALLAQIAALTAENNALRADKEALQQLVTQLRAGALLGHWSPRCRRSDRRSSAN